MTIVVSGCDYAECFVPLDRHNVCAAASISECWGALQHQHTPKRSQGGKACYVMLCAGHHGCIDNGEKYKGKRLQNDIHDGVYRIWERGKGELLYSLPIAAGPSTGSEGLVATAPTGAPSGLVPGSDWLTRWRSICESGNRLRRAVSDWHWAMAITFLEGDDDKYQYADECGLSESRLQQVVHCVEVWRDAPEALTSAATISQLERLTPMRRERPQEAAETLRKCIDEGMTDSDMRKLLRGPETDVERAVCPECKRPL